MRWLVALTMMLVASRALGQGHGAFDQATPGSALQLGLNRSAAVQDLDTVNAASDGMVCDGATDDTAALARAVARSRTATFGAKASGGMDVRLPMGRCLLSAAIPITLSNNQALTIGGHGQTATELLWTGETDGLIVTYASGASINRDATQSGASFQLENVTLARTPSTSAHTALAVIGDSANAGGTNQPSTTISNVMIRGTSNGGGWATGVLIQDAANTSVMRTRVVCPSPADPNAAAITSVGIGISYQTTGSRYATLHNLTDFSESGCDQGIAIGQRIQGVSVVSGNFTGGNTGINWQSVGRQEQLAVANSQFSTKVAGIQTYNLQNVTVTTSTFYNQNGYFVQAAAYATATGNAALAASLTAQATASSWAALNLQETDNIAVVGNTIAASNVGTEYGVHILNDTAIVGVGRPSVVSGNVFASIHGQGILAERQTTDVLVAGNNFDNIAGYPPIAIASTAAVQFSGNNFAGSLWAVGFPGGTGPSMATGAGGYLALYNLPISSGVSVPPGLASGILWQDSTGGLHRVP